MEHGSTSFPTRCETNAILRNAKAQEEQKAAAHLQRLGAQAEQLAGLLRDVIAAEVRERAATRENPYDEPFSVAHVYTDRRTTRIVPNEPELKSVFQNRFAAFGEHQVKERFVRALTRQLPDWVVVADVSVKPLNDRVVDVSSHVPVSRSYVPTRYTERAALQVDLRTKEPESCDVFERKA
ncbi:MAG: hypothetical protein AAF658_09915 [Myxococcota bacterium]